MTQVRGRRSCPIKPLRCLFFSSIVEVDEMNRFDCRSAGHNSTDYEGSWLIMFGSTGIMSNYGLYAQGICLIMVRTYEGHDLAYGSPKDQTLHKGHGESWTHEGESWIWSSNTTLSGGLWWLGYWAREAFCRGQAIRTREVELHERIQGQVAWGARDVKPWPSHIGDSKRRVV